MDYKNELKENNTDLEVIIDLLKSLPDLDIPSSGNGGGSVKQTFTTSASGNIPEYEYSYVTTTIPALFNTSAVIVTE